MRAEAESAELLPPEELVRAWLYVDSLEKDNELDRREALDWKEAILRRLRECGVAAVLGTG